MDNAIANTAQEGERIASRSKRGQPRHPVALHRMSQYMNGYSSVTDPRIYGSTWTNVKAEINIPDRHELFLLADGERKVEMETVTRKLILAFHKRHNNED